MGPPSPFIFGVIQLFQVSERKVFMSSTPCLEDLSSPESQDRVIREAEAFLNRVDLYVAEGRRQMAAKSDEVLTPED
jgi:hypothetical protein